MSPSVAEVPETAVATATPPPATEAPEPSDQSKIAAAVAVLESEPLPAGLIAYDVIEARLRGATGVVDIEVCGWTGDSVFDDVYLLAYRLQVADDGTVNASLETANITPGDCTNTTLIESALQFTRDYETFWRGVINDPSTFDAAEADEFWSGAFSATNMSVVEELAVDGLSYRGDYFDASLPDSSIVEVLYRNYEVGQIEVLELISCRDIPVDYGLYRGEVLVDDFRDSEGAVGNHAMARYFLVRADQRWLLVNDESLLYSDCLASPSGWFDGVNQLFADPVPWERVVGA